MKRLSFSKSNKLVNNRQFKDVLTRGIRVSRGLLMLYMAENDCGYPRLGVSVTKSYGKAAVRNRMKRLLREAFRQNQDQIPAGFDYLFMVSPEWLRQKADSVGSSGIVTELVYQQIEPSFLALVADAESLIKNRKNDH